MENSFLIPAADGQLPVGVFRASFFDGRTSAPHQAFLQVQEDGLHLTVQFQDGEVERSVIPTSAILRDEFNDKRCVVLRLNAEPQQRLEVQGQGFLKVLQQAYPMATFINHPYSFLQRFGVKAVLAAVVFIVVSVVLFFQVIMPWAVSRIAYNTPASVEQQVGATAFAQIEPILSFDDAKSKELQTFFDALKPEAAGDVKVVVAKSEVVNAFAVPGHIVVFEGLLNKIETPDQLASLLAHEYGHINNHHSLRGLYTQAGIGIVVGAIVGDPNSGAGFVLQNAGALVGMNYSRGMESEADDYAIELMYSEGLDPKGMVQLFQILQGEEGGSAVGEVPSFLSTHPATDNRIGKVEDAIAERTLPTGKRNAGIDGAFKSLKSVVSAPAEVSEEAETAPVTADELE